MQTLTGKIVSVQPTADGGYNGTNGWINTFTMTIQGPTAQVTGEIGSKKAPYPLVPGQEITVTAEQTQYGMKFKKINPQYSGGGQRGGGGQQSSPNINRLIVAQVAYKAIMEHDEAVIDEERLTRHVDMIMRVGEGKPAPQGGDPNPEYSDNPPEPTDDIPF